MHIFTRLAATLTLLLAAPAAMASPCGDLDIPNSDDVAAFDQVFLDQSWDGLGATMPLLDGATVAGLTSTLAANIQVTFTHCETVFAQALPPLTYRRANIYYSETGIGLIAYMDVMVLNGKASIVNFQVNTSFTEMMEFIR